ncbi:MAG: ATPase involved in chromosome partitioning [Actinobacteria bacterium]|nr:ATPase involved in chromosome partitioning [Actinomycetota bacterium]
MSLVIVAGDEALQERVQSLLPDSAADVARRWEGALAGCADVMAVADQAPTVVILGPEMGQDAAFGLAGQFDRRYPGISVLVMTELGHAAWQRALATGVRGLMSREVSDDDLRAQLARAIETAGGRAEAIGVPARLPARVITVVSPKGGSGKTIVSTNLAVGLALRHPGDVVLLDLNLEFGDVAYALALLPQHTIADAVSVLDELDATLLKIFLTRHHSGLYVLCAPQEPAVGEVIPVAAVKAVVRLIASAFGYVVIDTPGALKEPTRAALDLSTDAVMVCDMDVPAVRDLRKALDVLGERPIRRHLVLNRADSRVGLTRAAVAEAAGANFDWEIPSSVDVPVSLNEGRPLLLGNPRSRVARRLDEFAEWLAAGEDDPAGGAGGRAAPSEPSEVPDVRVQRARRFRLRG